MMQKRPEKRYANMREIAVVLESWLANHGYQFEPGSGEAAAKAKGTPKFWSVPPQAAATERAKTNLQF